MELILGLLLFLTGIQRLAVYPTAIVSVIALSGVGSVYRGFKLGNKLIWIPLLGIVVVTWLGDSDILAKLLMSLMPLVYLAGIRFRNNVFGLTEAFVVASTISVIVPLTIHGGRTGGLFSETNYNIATGVIALSTVVSRKYWIYRIGIVGLLCTGAVEGILVTVGLCVILVFNKQWKVLLVSMIIGVIVVTSIMSLNVFDEPRSNWTPDSIIEGWQGRVEQYEDAVHEISLWGYGYHPLELDGDDIHNGLLMAVDQVGIIGGLLWLWVLGYGILRRGSRKVWLVVGLLSLFDNYMWGQLGVWFWYLAGAYQGKSLLGGVNE